MENKRKILIIEDEPELRQLYNELLSTEFIIELAHDGEEGIQKFTAGMYDLVLLDMVMPRLDGVGFLEKRKTQSIRIQTPIIIMSNLRQDEVVKRCFELGANYYISKADITPDKIFSVISDILQESNTMNPIISQKTVSVA